MSITPPKLPMFRARSQQPPLSPEFAQALAQTVVEWSRVEFGLATDISTMMCFPIVRKLAKRTPPTFKQKLDLWCRSIEALYPAIDQYQRQKSAIADAARKLAKHRNHLIHGHWQEENGRADTYCISNLRGLESIEHFESLDVSREMVEDLLSSIRDLAEIIQGFMISRMIHAADGAVGFESTGRE